MNTKTVRTRLENFVKHLKREVRELGMDADKASHDGEHVRAATLIGSADAAKFCARRISEILRTED